MPTIPKQPAPGGHPALNTGTVSAVAQHHATKHILRTGREFLTHWAVAGAIVAMTGVAPDHWMATLIGLLHLPSDALHLWAAGIDLRWIAVGAGMTLMVGDVVWRRARLAAAPAPAEAAELGAEPPPVAVQAVAVQPVAVQPLPDKPSIAVLPFTNLSGDPAEEYFADGITEDIITKLSRFRALFVISRNSSFSYKGKPADVRQVGRELGVRYVLEGSARKAGNRTRVSAQLIDTATGMHLWAEHYERTLDDVFAVQEDVTRGIVAAVAPEVELAEVDYAQTATPNESARHLAWRARGLMNDGVRQGNAATMLEAIAVAQRALVADPRSLAACDILAWANWSCHLYRWGPEPEKALDAMAAAVERMSSLNSLDHRTLTASGVYHVVRGEAERGIADLHRAVDVNPNSAQSLMWLGLCEAMTGQGEQAREHAMLSLRLNPRDTWIGVAHIALALVSFCERDYAEAVRMAELAIQSEPAVPLRRVIMIACCAQLGDQTRAMQEVATLNGFAPGFMGSLFRGEFQVFRRPEDMARLLDSLRLAGVIDAAA